LLEPAYHQLCTLHLYTACTVIGTRLDLQAKSVMVNLCMLGICCPSAHIVFCCFDCKVQCQQNIAELEMPTKPLQRLGRLCRWHAAWQERCQALERLRLCISRKRISFRLFKQWYWESFDDDVQVPALTSHFYVLFCYSSHQHCHLWLAACKSNCGGHLCMVVAQRVAAASGCSMKYCCS